MDLNFVDPPVPTDARTVELSVTAENAGGEFEKIAVWLETGEGPRKAFLDEPLAAFAAILRKHRTRSDYIAALPMIARFLTIEMDPEIEGEVGIGRMKKPPRFGGLYRKQLADADAHLRASRMAERLIFSGYAGMTAVSTVRDDRFDLLERPLQDRWSAFIRAISSAYLSLLGSVDVEQQPVEAYLLLIARDRMRDYAELVNELKLARGLRPFSKTQAHAYARFFVGVGAAVWGSNTSTTNSIADLAD